MAVIALSRSVGPVPIDCILEENHSSEIDITEIPVETGARITDHAVVLPKRVSLDIADANAAGSFAALVRLQESRAPFNLVTGLSVYRNMLIKRIDAKRDAKTGRILRGTVDLQEIIIVATAYTSDESGGKQGQPGGTKSTKSAATAPERSGDIKTADRASSTTMRGDAGTTTTPPPNRGILRSVF